MKLKRKSRIAAIGTISLALAAALAGCELIVDFNRTLIDGGTIEGGGGETSADTGVDTGVDGTKPDTGTDAPADTSIQDTGTDTATDTGIADTGADVPSDTSPD